MFENRLDLAKNMMQIIHITFIYMCKYQWRTFSAVERVSEAPPEISRGAPHTLLAYYYELQ